MKYWIIHAGLWSILAFTACNEEKTKSNPDPYPLVGTEQRSVRVLEDRRKEVRDLEANMLDSTLQVDAKTARKLLLKAMGFVNDFPKDKDAPGFLMIAIRATRGLNDHPATIAHIDRMMKEYPNFAHLSDCYYQKAFTLDFLMNKPEEAKTAYRTILRVFPDYRYQDQIRARLETIGLPDSVLLKRFEQMQDSSGNL